VDAGYRWAYWTLEEAGVVKRGNVLKPESVFATEEYWNPGSDATSKWLVEEVLPSVRIFLERHREHRIVFDEDAFLDTGANSTSSEGPWSDSAGRAFFVQVNGARTQPRPF
jgi:hypothetical protein